MTEWMMEHWFIEAVGTIGACLILVWILIKLAKLMDKD